VIDYDFNRRARDLGEIKRRTVASKSAATTRRQPKTQDLALDAIDEAARVDLAAAPKSTTMIELNAMMTDYERRQRLGGAKCADGEPAAAVGSHHSCSSSSGSSSFL
jgi:hypothetical protein